MKTGKGNRSTRRKPAPAPLFPPQVPFGQARDRTRATALGSQRLTAWTMGRPVPFTCSGSGFPCLERTRCKYTITFISSYQITRLSNGRNVSDRTEEKYSDCMCLDNHKTRKMNKPYTASWIIVLDAHIENILCLLLDTEGKPDQWTVCCGRRHGLRPQPTSAEKISSRLIIATIIIIIIIIIIITRYWFTY
jgi:hypothetical protein